MPGPETATVPPAPIVGESLAAPSRTKLVPIWPTLRMKSLLAAKSWTTPSE